MASRWLASSWLSSSMASSSRLRRLRRETSSSEFSARVLRSLICARKLLISERLLLRSASSASAALAEVPRAFVRSWIWIRSSARSSRASSSSWVFSLINASSELLRLSSRLRSLSTRSRSSTSWDTWAIKALRERSVSSSALLSTCWATTKIIRAKTTTSTNVDRASTKLGQILTPRRLVERLRAICLLS